MADLLADKAVTQYADVRAHTYMNSFGLEVLGLPDYARTDWRLERHDVVKAFSLLRNHYSVVLVDCAKALNSGVMEAVLPEARALVVVTSTSIDAIRKTRHTLDWLCNNGYQRLVRVDGACHQPRRAGQGGRCWPPRNSSDCPRASPPRWCCRSIGTYTRAKRSSWID